MNVLFWMYRGNQDKKGNKNSGFVLVPATVKFDRQEMCWYISPDRETEKHISQPIRRERVEQDICFIYYKNDFDCVHSILPD